MILFIGKACEGVHQFVQLDQSMIIIRNAETYGSLFQVPFTNQSMLIEIRDPSQGIASHHNWLHSDQKITFKFAIYHQQKNGKVCSYIIIETKSNSMNTVKLIHMEQKQANRMMSRITA